MIGASISRATFGRCADGTIRANGVPITDLSPDRWREYVALVPQRPYLFYGTVGAQLLLRRFESGGLCAVVAFLIGFYGLLVGSKMLVALVVNQSRGWLRGPAYRRVITGSGILLIGLGLLLAWDGAGALLSNG